MTSDVPHDERYTIGARPVPSLAVLARSYGSLTP
jgi:hypothetical protein